LLFSSSAFEVAWLVNPFRNDREFFERSPLLITLYASRFTPFYYCHRNNDVAKKKAVMGYVQSA